MILDKEKMVYQGPSIAYLVVTDVAACRDFWTALLGFHVVVEDSRDGEVDFLLLHGLAEKTRSGDAPVILEYQRHAGLSAGLQARLRPDERAVVYLWLTRGLEELAVAVAASRPQALVETRTAPYGADELVIADPHGHLFIFGQRHA